MRKKLGCSLAVKKKMISQVLVMYICLGLCKAPI